MALPLEWPLRAMSVVVAAVVATVVVLVLVQTWRVTRFKSLLRDHEHRFSPARLAMLFPTIAVAAFFLRGVLATGEMPQLPPEWFTLYLTSQAPILVAKSHARTGGR